ncbi:STAS domain-containing protein [Actinophytocola gossypii]|uniref:Anti-sigma factor antagonist n=1 Tax=Actinophytocola gossypii TaxID=2812003 RepID=A0ABT2J9E5_9PSEU|nr:STAS domain-containing protein [Actinophytocola gossypii]MCT2584488.1 STAS domain-containing protein [Actinophytocola gossypii]
MNDNNQLYSEELSVDLETLTGDRPLRVKRTVQGHTVLVEACGEVDLVTALMLEEQLEYAEAIVVPPAPVVVDLSRVAFLGARGLGTLVHHHHRCRSLGSTLRIVAQQPEVLRPIHVTGLDTTLCVVPNVHDAQHQRTHNPPQNHISST